MSNKSATLQFITLGIDLVDTQNIQFGHITVAVNMGHDNSSQSP